MDHTTDTDVLHLRNMLSRLVAGRPVSLVGNAASLFSSRHGAEIDAGCVVRLNSGVPVRARAQGRRVDLHCFSTMSSFRYNMGRARWRVRLKKRYFDGTPSVWMGWGERDTAEDPQQLFYPLPLLEALTERLGAPPSVGARSLHMLHELTTADLRLFGFDFKQSTTFYRTKENLGSHDWEAERRFALSLLEGGRVTLRS
ncbi:hypothetical protein [Falsirhodobacter sp. 20TX0035]|uniref:hypothetical protein n=1 Tax=Falsirhodobacter sp. 20TX0035 TaxID=3022019 RepID=UPI00232DEB7B|nr:hypothetical protein [Falsirhodobacter sp. 20TX0035]MDB6453080.1 hypothetical protein [Falsirhodobacter sp. 20TX0035]